MGPSPLRPLPVLWCGARLAGSALSTGPAETLKSGPPPGVNSTTCCQLEPLQPHPCIGLPSPTPSSLALWTRVHPCSPSHLVGTPLQRPGPPSTSVMTVPVSGVTAVTLNSLLRKLGLKKIHFLGVLLSQCCFPTYLTTLLYQRGYFSF